MAFDVIVRIFPHMIGDVDATIYCDRPVIFLNRRL
jgi:hypothetical protein